MRHQKPSSKGGRVDGPSQRMLRAGELVRHALAEILREEALQDPALLGVSVTVTEVRMSPDLKHATCFVEPLGAGVVGAATQGGAVNVAHVVSALNRAARFLRGRLGHHVELKFTPQLHFRHDESFDAAAHMNTLFARPEVARDLKSSPSPDGEGDHEVVEGFAGGEQAVHPGGHRPAADPLPGFADTPPSNDGGDQ